MCKTNEKEGGFQTFYRTGLQISIVNLYLHPLFTATKKEILSHLKLVCSSRG
jgi:hypothetical protein